MATDEKPTEKGEPDEKKYKIELEGGLKALKIDYSNSIYSPAIEDDPIVMARVFDILLKEGRVQKISFTQKEEYVYDSTQVHLLYELVEVYKKLTEEENIFDFGKQLGEDCRKYFAGWYDFARGTLQGIKQDPIGTFVELRRKIREETIKQKELAGTDYPNCLPSYLQALQRISDLMAGTRIIKLASQFVAGLKPGDREIYRRFIKPTVQPFFIYTKLTTQYPTGAEELESYKVAEDADVLILKVPHDIRPIYHIIPPEFRLAADKYSLLTEARQVLAEHRPERQEFLDMERTREMFFSISRDLLRDLAKTKAMELTKDELDGLAKILVRYTIGFGLIEIVLSDPNVQDVVVNAPMGLTSVSLIHGDYGECRTNIVPLQKEGESWATKLRLISGRPLDEANPVLDTDLSIPGARARVAVMQLPLSPSGLSFAFRRHRDKSWTLPLFIESKMLTPLAAGLISFLIDNGRTILIAGTRSAGKTSLLGAMLVELMRSNRVLTVEDSVTGDCKIIIKRNGTVEKITIGELIDKLGALYGFKNKLSREVVKNADSIDVLTFDVCGKIKFAPASLFIRHKVKKPIYQITTATGRKIRATGDHSLFTIGDKTVLEAIKVNELRPGSFLATPRTLPVQNKELSRINLLGYATQLGGLFAIGPQIKLLIARRWAKIKILAKKENYTKSGCAAWKRNSILPMKILAKLKHTLSAREANIKAKAQSKPLPAFLELDENFLTFVGLWLADGCYDRSSVIVSACEAEEREVVRRVALKLGLPVKLHSDKFSLMINSKALREVMRNVLELTGNAYTKKIPNWVYQLSQKQIACVLRGIFSGDGCAADKEVVLASASPELLKDLQTLLLTFGIILRVRHQMRRDKTYDSSISALKFLKIFRDKVGFVQRSKMLKLEKLCSKISTHDNTDIVPLSNKAKLELAQITNLNVYDYVARQNNIGREHLSFLLRNMQNAPNPVKYLAESDMFWDRITEIRKLDLKYINVYDISVPETENFVCENIVAHNTLELPVAQLRQLGYDIQSMKTRSVITGAEAEVPADQAIRTALRLGDSALIVGEVRSLEAKALFEAMRVGALAKAVMGTIHGDSPYSVFDRVVNDLGVPKTSFKATDVIIVANTVTSPSGMERLRRLTQISEVRKFWSEDPLLEKGFADLMAYDAKSDSLNATDSLVEGESEVLKAVGARVKEFAGNWDAIWKNIELRAKIKQAIVDASHSAKNPDLLEAPFVVKSNDQFHRISQEVADEVGFTDTERVFNLWNDWLKQEIKKGKA